jgi:hypothetical protein
MNAFDLFNKYEQEMMLQVYHVQGQTALLDSDVANLFGVEIRNLTQTVMRFRDRFPSNFMIELSGKELEEYRGTLESSRAGKIQDRDSVMAFTTQGLLMLVFVLKCPMAEFVSIYFAEIASKYIDFLNQNRESLFTNN